MTRATRERADCGRPQRLLAAFGRRSRLHREDGQGIIEFALIAPLLLLVVIGALEFGRAWGNKNNLVHLANEAARMAVVNNVNCSLLNSEASADFPGKTAAFSITEPAGNTATNPVTVTVSVGFSAITSIVPGLPSTISGTASMALEAVYTGPSAC